MLGLKQALWRRAVVPEHSGVGFGVSKVGSLCSTVLLPADDSVFMLRVQGLKWLWPTSLSPESHISDCCFSGNHSKKSDNISTVCPRYSSDRCFHTSVPRFFACFLARSRVVPSKLYAREIDRPFKLQGLSPTGCKNRKISPFCFPSQWLRGNYLFVCSHVVLSPSTLFCVCVLC